MSLTGAENSSDTNCWQAAAFFEERSRRAVCVTKLLLEAGVCARHALPPSNLAVLGLLRIPRLRPYGPSTAMAGQ
jgi:hypothetical protein